MAELKYSKRKQTASRGAKRRLKISEIRKKEGYCEATEAQLQNQCDDILEALNLEYLRIPDDLYRILYRHANQGVKNAVSRGMGGHADNLVFIPINDKYSLCLHLELKSKKGKLHGRQKTRKVPTQISRSPETTDKLLREFMAFATKIKIRLMDWRGWHEEQRNALRQKNPK